MNIGLLNMEPKYKNLAIEKLRIYHQAKGDYVEDYFALNHYSKVYCSSIFDFTKKGIVPKGAVCGGSGFDLTTVLPLGIDDIKPHLNFGFLSRGCPNKCPFCVVPNKEGKFKVIGCLKDLWNGVKGILITLLDNNPLTDIDFFLSVCNESLEYHVKLDWNQGLDHRKLTTEAVAMMKKISHTEYRFAFDSPAYYKSVDRAVKLLQENGINRCLWYVLVGFNTAFQEDLDRVNYLKERNQNAFIQRYVRHPIDWRITALARWVNQHDMFQAMTWEQWLDGEYGRMQKSERLAKAIDKGG